MNLVSKIYFSYSKILLEIIIEQLMWKMFINKNTDKITRKLLNSLISMSSSKLIPTILLASILVISFSLVISPNAFAYQVQDTPVATYTYPDDWMIVNIQGNGEVISFHPVNEPMVVVHKTVLLDSSNAFGQIVDDSMQNSINNGVEVSIRNNEPGLFWFDRSDGTGVGYTWIGQVDNDVVVTEYFADPSKFEQYGDPRAFHVATKFSPQEANNNQNLNDQAFQIEMEGRNEMYNGMIESMKNFGDSFNNDNDNSWTD